MGNAIFKVYKQKTPYDSPWFLTERIRLMAWEFFWGLFCVWSPKMCNSWRLFWLRIFGCKIHGKPFVHQRARFQMPWNVILHDHATIGDRANLYSLGVIEIKANAIIAQEAYLSAGTHDFCDPRLPLATAKITIGENVFVGARAFVMPGISIEEGTIIGACSVVTKNMPAWTVCAGNPCKPLKPRIMKKI